MNYRTVKITISALLVMLSGLVCQRGAAACTCSTVNCTSSITAPCVINSSGSYTVMQDFQVNQCSNCNTACNPGGIFGYFGVGICINTGVNNVTIDLAGHAIKADNSQGANVNDAICGNTGVTVKNGIIDAGNNGFLEGVQAGDNARIEGLQVTGTTTYTTNYSIKVGNKSVVADSLVVNSAITGISCGTDCLISGNVVNSAVSGTTTGISTSSGGLIEENTVMGNATGLSLGTSTGYGENVLVNTTDHSGGTSMGKNICSNGSLC